MLPDSSDTFRANVTPGAIPRGVTIAEIDGLRAVAISLVMLRHFTPPNATGWPYALMSSGWIGVDLFFAISGFLITGICLDHRGPGFLTAFYGRRALRIIPPYFFVIALAGVVSWAAGESLSDYPAYATFTTNLRIASSGAWPKFSHLWSLAVEEQFYLVWPLAVVLLSVRNIRRVALVAIPVALAVRLSTSPVAGFVLMPARMDALAVGCWLAAAMRDPFARAKIARGVTLASRLPLVAWIAVLALLCAWLGDPFSPMTVTVGLSAVALASGFVLATVLAGDPNGALRRVLRQPALRAAGRVSYGMYLLHVLINMAVRQVPGLSDRGVIFALVASLATYVMALLMWRTIEAPALAHKDRFPYPA